MKQKSQKAPPIDLRPKPKREAFLHMRVSKAFKEALEKNAKTCGLKLTDFVERCCTSYFRF